MLIILEQYSNNVYFLSNPTVHPPSASSSPSSSSSLFTSPAPTPTAATTAHHPHQRQRQRGGKHTLIERRNQRERVRVRAVNEAFARLRQVVPSARSSSKRVSKVKTLKRAVEYIGDLRRRLATFEGMLLASSGIDRPLLDGRRPDNCEPFGAYK